MTRDASEVTDALRDAASAMTTATDPETVSGGEPLPVGRGAIRAQPLTNASGDRALLLSQGDVSRALLLAEPGTVAETGLERVVVMPFDEEFETRIDGDALATFIARPAGPRASTASGPIPTWASAFGFVLIIVVVVLTVIGGAAVFSWILDALG